MRLDPKETKEALKELLDLPDISSRIGARRIVRGAIDLITQMQSDLRRQGFHEYNDKEEQE